MTLQVRDLDHLVLRTAHLDEMIEFYREVLGCAVERRVDDIGLVQLRAGGALVDLVDAAGSVGRAGGPPPGSDGLNLDHFCVRVEPFDEAAIRHHLAEHGVEPGDIKRRYGAQGYGPSMYIRDPDGNTVELKGPPESPEDSSGQIP